MQPSDLAALDKWIARQADEMTRPQALRAMMDMVVELKAQGEAENLIAARVRLASC